MAMLTCPSALPSASLYSEFGNKTKPPAISDRVLCFSPVVGRGYVVRKAGGCRPTAKESGGGVNEFACRNWSEHRQDAIVDVIPVMRSGQKLDIDNAISLQNRANRAPEHNAMPWPTTFQLLSNFRDCILCKVVSPTARSHGQPVRVSLHHHRCYRRGPALHQRRFSRRPGATEPTPLKTWPCLFGTSRANGI